MKIVARTFRWDMLCHLRVYRMMMQASSFSSRLRIDTLSQWGRVGGEAGPNLRAQGLRALRGNLPSFLSKSLSLETCSSRPGSSVTFLPISESSRLSRTNILDERSTSKNSVVLRVPDCIPSCKRDVHALPGEMEATSTCRRGFSVPRTCLWVARFPVG